MADSATLNSNDAKDGSATPQDTGVSSVIAGSLTVLEAYVVLGGIVSFGGYALDAPRLTDWIDSGISIQPNTTVAVTTAGLGLLGLRQALRRLTIACGCLLLFIGTSVLFEHLSSVDLGVDQLLMFDRTWGQTGVISPGRMGPAGATSWTILGLVLLLALGKPGSPARRYAVHLALLTASVSMLGLVGYPYGA